ncbi:DUF1737 domain-containing protein [Afifella sp. IM 167]|uniref:DUF1737 domain-containing protein n=1 Tax=Afifella sp. IM 167 TaxID=2033586 RepID=UPI001CCDA34C|nr:DUF1737 domain-containing protein [Afifella sp. IM 167]MBZ8132663.1 hypothetical protein [Afifella sp. IM 167]
MKLYRLLTGLDDPAFCKRVSAALNQGWALHGSPSLTFSPEANRPICAQAIVKEVEGTYDEESSKPDFSLGDY